MSKKHGQRRKRKKSKPQPFACPRCHGPADTTPGALLNALASVLNACADSGVRVRLAHGFAETSEGYVLPLSGGRYTARTLAYDPLAPPLAGED